MKKKYIIAYLTLQGKTFTYTVSNYEIVEGNFVEFTDEKTGEKKRLHSSRCEINEKEVYNA